MSRYRKSTGNSKGGKSDRLTFRAVKSVRLQGVENMRETDFYV